MRRDPNQKFVEDYMSTVKLKRIYPLIHYHRCRKCGMEYTREPMYLCRHFDWIFGKSCAYEYGCHHCFNSKSEFKKYLEDNQIIETEEALTGNSNK